MTKPDYTVLKSNRVRLAGLQTGIKVGSKTTPGSASLLECITGGGTSKLVRRVRKTFSSFATQ